MIKYTILDIQIALDMTIGIVDITEKHPKNLAIICEMSNGNIIVLPNKGREAVLFNNRIEMNTFINEYGIPLPESEHNIFAKHQDLINNLNQNTDLIIKKLTQLLDFEILIDMDMIYLKKISTACTKYIRKKGKDTAYKELYFYISIFCGELLKKRLKSGEWSTHKRYGVNPYLEPALFIGNKELYIFKVILDEIYRNKLNIINCLNTVLPLDEQINLI